MYVTNFRWREIEACGLVKRFYAALHGGDGGTVYEPPIWAESIGDFDESVRAEGQLKVTMRREYGSRRCRQCGGPCIISQVTSNKGGNLGKWYVKCKQVYRSGHTFDFVPVRII